MSDKTWRWHGWTWYQLLGWLIITILSVRGELFLAGWIGPDGGWIGPELF